VPNREGPGHPPEPQCPRLDRPVSRDRRRGRSPSARQALLDGEIAVLLPNGTTSFQALQNLLTGEGRASCYFVFDLLHLDGQDLTGATLEARKRRPGDSGRSRRDGRYRYSTHVVGPGRGVLPPRPAGLRWRASSPSGVTRPTSRPRAELAQGEVHPGAGVRHRGLHRAQGDAAGLGACCSASTGRRRARVRREGRHRVHRAVAGQLRKRLDRLRTRRIAVRGAAARRRQEARWVKPVVVAEVEFSEWTRTVVFATPPSRAFARGQGGYRGRPRAARRPGRAQRRPRPLPSRESATRPEDDAPTPERLRRRRGRISHPARVVYPEDGVTKARVARVLRGGRRAHAAPSALASRRAARCPDGLAAVLLPEAPGFLGALLAPTRPDPREGEVRRSTS
jgi:bifunctional non-homologous end joining protein LigD